MKVTVSAAGDGIATTGYRQVPIAIQKDGEYTFSAFVKSDKDVTMTVAVKDGATVYATADVAVKANANWVKYVKTVKGTETKSDSLTFSLTFGSAGEYCVDAVSFETDDSTAGIKNYIFDAIKALGPKFVRFPGGCIIEGDAGNGGAKTKEVYDWKNSIGAVVSGNEAGDDVVPAFTYTLDDNGTVREETTYGEPVTRTHNLDLWGYEMEYGVGFYEYFLMCDALDAVPIPILNCGFSDQGGAASNPSALAGRHDQYVDDYIADAMDLVAFANGSTDAKDERENYWANVRKNMGHPEPFGVKYLGIGNEQWGDYYTGYYEHFVEAFRAAAEENPALYGGIQLIVGNGVSFRDCEYSVSGSVNTANTAARNYLATGKIDKISEYGIVDHHYYMNYVDFFQHTDLYDQYRRDEETGYHVFVGEYSANSDTSLGGQKYDFEQNNWMTALSEAAYMTGIERNGDVVQLAAYAPMFGKCADNRRPDNTTNQWDTDMMYYTNTELLLTPNYYVQQLFMHNTGTDRISSKVQYAKGAKTSFELRSGSSTTSLSKLYEVVTKDEATGDIIVKIVNAGSDELEINVTLNNTTVTGKANITVIKADSNLAVNTLGNETIKPSSYEQGLGAEFGYAAPKYSVTVIRLHTK